MIADDENELGRLLAAAPRIEEPVMRVLERLQTGWQPKHDEIRYSGSSSRRRSRPEAVIIGQPETREGVTRTDQILWATPICAGLSAKAASGD